MDVMKGGYKGLKVSKDDGREKERVKAKTQGAVVRAEVKSAQVVLLYGLLDAQEHGGEPLVKPRDGVKLLNLFKLKTSINQ